MDEVLEAKFFKDWEGAHAAATGLAVNQRGLGFVEFGELRFEVGGHDVDVLGGFDVTVFELVGRADIDDDGFAFGDDFRGIVGFDVFGLVFSECEGGNEQEEGGEEGFHGMEGQEVNGQEGQGVAQWTSTGMRLRRW